MNEHSMNHSSTTGDKQISKPFDRKDAIMGGYDKGVDIVFLLCAEGLFVYH